MEFVRVQKLHATLPAQHITLARPPFEERLNVPGPIFGFRDSLAMNPATIVAFCVMTSCMVRPTVRTSEIPALVKLFGLW
jgi:hypothetical protein